MPDVALSTLSLLSCSSPQADPCQHQQSLIEIDARFPPIRPAPLFTVNERHVSAAMLPAGGAGRGTELSATVSDATSRADQNGEVAKAESREFTRSLVGYNDPKMSVPQ